MESEDFITLSNTSEASENKDASLGLGPPDGNDSESVDPEAATLQEGTTCDDVNQAYNESEPHHGPAGDMVGFSSMTEETSLFTGTVIVSDNVNNLNSTTPVEDGDLAYRVTSGVKRSRVTSDEQPPSVHVIFNSITRQSKQKLEALLHQWSEWDAKHCSSFGLDAKLESGEATYYPALHVGSDKQSTVSFWLDDQTSKNKEHNQTDDVFVPVYDRSYALALTSGDGNLTRDSDLVDDSRCFNCGSYNHSMRECPKPRDSAAVKNARKQHKAKRNQNPTSRTPTRYYQDTPSGKYDGLMPGVLEAETRKLLGLRELDPPPWLDRMREIGYPPGYLEDDEKEPSGITIFGEEEIKEEEKEKEDGEIQDMELSPPPSLPTLPKKMSVEFPGINAPIPPKADERLWAPASSNYDSLAYRSSRRLDYPSDSSSRWSRDSRDDGPPGVGSSVYSYSSRHANYNPTDSYLSPRRDTHLSRSSSFERSNRDRSPTHRENVYANVSYHSQYYGSKSSFSASDDHRRYENVRDPYPDNSGRHGHREREGRENRHRNS